MNDTLMTETLDDVCQLARRWPVWAGLAVAGLITGLTGPFGTYDALSLPLRSAYWLTIILTTFWIGYATSFAVATWLERLGLGARPATGIGAAIASLPVTGWIAGLRTIVFGAEPWTDAVSLLPYVLVITVVVAFFWETIQAPTRRIAPAPVQADPPAWLDQLPPDLGRDLILLQAQDHYVRVKTAAGETLIRARLQDAADALGDRGLRLHRSWWVARCAIEAMVTRKGVP